jgi:pre-mRNA cleavage complex 2 protein Pcf11
MEEMIALWRRSGPDGGDLYGPGVREAIESDIFGSAAYPPYQPTPSPFVSREAVLAVLKETLDFKNRESISKPWDAQARQQLGVLLQIQDMLGSGRVAPHELQPIMDQLKAMGGPSLQTHTLQPAFPPASSFTLPPVQPAHQPMSPPAPKLPPFPPSLPHDPYRAPGPPLPPQMPQPVQQQYPAIAAPTPTHVTTPTPVLSNIPVNVADILRNLNTSGLLSVSNTPDIQAKPEVRSVLDGYEDAILNMGLKLTAMDINTCDDSWYSLILADDSGTAFTTYLFLTFRIAVRNVVCASQSQTRRCKITWTGISDVIGRSARPKDEEHIADGYLELRSVVPVHMPRSSY